MTLAAASVSAGSIIVAGVTVGSATPGAERIDREPEGIAADSLVAEYAHDSQCGCYDPEEYRIVCGGPRNSVCIN